MLGNRPSRELAIADLLTPRDVMRLLDEHGLAPRKSAGQNFVVDANTVRRIVAGAELRPDDVVVEIGPGLGSLTLALAARAARVVAVEIDAGLVKALAEVLAGVGNVEVVHADALRVDLGAVVGGSSARLVANLPYNTATPLLFHALDDPAIVDLFVMVQREVGERWQARPGDPRYGGVSLKLALVAEARITHTIPRTVFHPVPNVDSVMVRVQRRADAETGDRLAALRDLVDTAFAQRRKTLRNTLRGITDPVALEQAAARAGIDLGARPETLGRDRFLALAAELLPVGP